MKQPGKLLAYLFTAITFAACQKDIQSPKLQDTLPEDATESDGYRGGHGNGKNGGYVSIPPYCNYLNPAWTKALFHVLNRLKIDP